MEVLSPAYAFTERPAYGATERSSVRVEEQIDAEYALTYSVRLFQPFLRVLRASPVVPDVWIEALDKLELNERIPVAVAHQMLDAFMQSGGDPDIGLKAARQRNPGDAGAIDYAISSASTASDAIEAAARYAKLVSDALEVRLEVIGDEAHVRIENRAPLPRVARDFQVAALFRALSGVWACKEGSSVRVLFSHAAPEDRSEYARTFGETPVFFSAPFSGFVFDAACLRARLTSADLKLHDAILRHADQMLDELPRARQLTERVRSAISMELAGGNPSVTNIALRLHMSARTLERRLEREGTTFSAVLEDLRKQLALRYVGNHNLELAEIAFLLGFSQTTAFHRAFKRWTDETPLEYRRAQRAERCRT